jgi:hypothetical protein
MDNRLPSATDTSLKADLSRIKFYRNMIVHCDSALQEILKCLLTSCPMKITPKKCYIKFSNIFWPMFSYAVTYQAKGGSKWENDSNRPRVKRHLRMSCNIFMVLFSGEPSSKDFDITLMICLLRNLIPIDLHRSSMIQSLYHQAKHYHNVQWCFCNTWS